VIGEEWRGHGGIPLDATRPVPQIVDDIVARMR
jgi:hypothetical protein